jgi:hypothetical protein
MPAMFGYTPVVASRITSLTGIADLLRRGRTGTGSSYYYVPRNCVRGLRRAGWPRLT